MSEIEATVDRISKHPGVEGIMVLHPDGTALKTTFDNENTTKYSKLILPFAQLSTTSIRDIDPKNELTFAKINSVDWEIIIIPSEVYYVIAFIKNAKK